MLAANALDLEAAPGFGLNDAQADRLRLSSERIDGIAQGMEQVADFPEPIGEVMETTARPNGLKLQKVRVPLGVVFFVYESRPNVTADAAALCVKSGNAVILRGGKAAAHSSQAIVEILRTVAEEKGNDQKLERPGGRFAQRVATRRPAPPRAVLREGRRTCPHWGANS